MAAIAGPAAFVIPFWNPGEPIRTRWVLEALDCVLAQTDPDVAACVVVDDQQPARPDLAMLRARAEADRRVQVVLADRDRGPGNSRNLGVRRAAELGAPFVCFLDADDLTPPNRAEVVRATLAGDPDCSVVYSGFSVVDEHGADRDPAGLIDGIRNIMRELATDPLEGYDVWIESAVARHILTIPSAVNVRTELALAIPFPSHVRAHEDTHTWFRYSASGAKVVFRPEIAGTYRVPTWADGSSIRDRMGGREAFDRMQAEVILPGVREAVEMAIGRGVIDAAAGREIEVRYLLKSAARRLREGTPGVSADLVAQAADISPEHCRSWLPHYDLEHLRASHPQVMERVAAG